MEPRAGHCLWARVSLGVPEWAQAHPEPRGGVGAHVCSSEWGEAGRWAEWWWPGGCLTAPFSLQARPSWAALWPAGWGPRPHPMGARCPCPLTSPSAPPPPAACPWCSCGPPMPMKVRSVWRAGAGCWLWPQHFPSLPTLLRRGHSSWPWPWGSAMSLVPLLFFDSQCFLLPWSRPSHMLFPCLQPPLLPTPRLSPLTCGCRFICVFVWEIPILLPE